MPRNGLFLISSTLPTLSVFEAFYFYLQHTTATARMDARATYEAVRTEMAGDI